MISDPGTFKEGQPSSQSALGCGTIVSPLLDVIRDLGLKGRRVWRRYLENRSRLASGSPRPLEWTRWRRSSRSKEEVGVPRINSPFLDGTRECSEEKPALVSVLKVRISMTGNLNEVSIA